MLQKLQDNAKGALRIVRLDVTDENSIWNSANEVEQIVGDGGIDYLVNNAAVVSTFCIDKVIQLTDDMLVERPRYRVRFLCGGAQKYHSVQSLRSGNHG